MNGKNDIYRVMLPLKNRQEFCYKYKTIDILDIQLFNFSENVFTKVFNLH